MITQVEIAKYVGVDVSSVNKIINKAPGKFSDETIAKVMKAAKKFKYNFRRSSKANYRRLLMELFPKDGLITTLSQARGISEEKVLEIMDVLYGRL